MVSSRATSDPHVVWEREDELWLDHVTLTLADLELLAPARSITMWAVKMPPGMLARLPRLEGLDFRGGTGADASFIDGCNGLRALTINQVRGLRDLTSLASLDRLEVLDLFGLPQVTELPTLKSLTRLREVSIGSMKGLQGLSGLLDAPGLETLTFLKSVGVTIADAEAIRESSTIRSFEWFAEDVPDRMWVPFVDIAGKPGDTEKKEKK